MPELTNMDEYDKSYVKQMEAWFKEQEAREKEIKTVIETSQEIARQNVIQLEWLQSNISRAKKEYEEWLTQFELKEENAE